MDLKAKLPADPLRDTNYVRQLAGVGATTIWRWIKSGAIPAPLLLPSGHRRWRQSVLDAWVAQFTTRQNGG